MATYATPWAPIICEEIPHGCGSLAQVFVCAFWKRNPTEYVCLADLKEFFICCLHPRPPKTLQNLPRTIPKPPQNCPRTTPERTRNGPGTTPKPSQNHTKTIPTRYKHNAKTIPKPSQNDPRTIPASSQKVPKPSQNCLSLKHFEFVV